MLEQQLFVVDGSIWTSAGMTAGIDQALAMVEQDQSTGVARAVSKKFVLQSRRNGSQPQSSLLLDIEPRSDRIQTAVAYARSHLHMPLNIEQLAEAAHLSPRQFSRAFRAETGVSPAKAIEKLRMDMALMLIKDGRHTIESIALQTGFGDAERMRRAFIREFGKPPRMMRQDARCDPLAS